MTEIRDTRIAFIGSGKVAYELALIFQFKGLHISGISSRNTTTGKSLAHKLNCPFEENPLLLEADLIIVSTNDASVMDLHALFDSKQLFAYTAGAVDLNKLSGVNWGVFYPLQTFTSNRHLRIDEIPVLIEANDPKLQHLLSELCDYVGFRYAYCSTADRQKYHLAAVFINNFAFTEESLELRRVDLRIPYTRLPNIRTCKSADIEVFGSSRRRNGGSRRGNRRSRGYRSSPWDGST